MRTLFLALALLLSLGIEANAQYNPATVGQFMRGPGDGNVTDNEMLRANGTTGRLAQGTDIIVADASGSKILVRPEGSNALRLAPGPTANGGIELEDLGGSDVAVVTTGTFSIHALLRVIPASSAPIAASTASGSAWMTNGTPDDNEWCASCAANTLHVFDGTVYQPAW